MRRKVSDAKGFALIRSREREEPTTRLDVVSAKDPVDDLPSSLGELIRKQRQLAELPMRQLASMVGISNPYLSQIENGLRAPSEQVLDSIARSLGLSPEDLRVEEDEDAEPDLRAAIKAERSLTAAQRRALVEVYDAMLAANKAKSDG